MQEVVVKFVCLDRYGYESMLSEVEEYPRSRGERIVVLKKRKSRPRRIELLVRSNVLELVLLDLTIDAGAYRMYEKVGDIWEEIL